MDDTTKDLGDRKAFEHKVNVRLAKIEDKLDRLAMETKPMWVAQLEARIDEILKEQRDQGRKLDVLNRNIMQMGADLLHVERRVDALEVK